MPLPSPNLKMPPILLASPRSGSTPIALILGRYFEWKYQLKFLGEAWNPSSGHLFENQIGELSFNPQPTGPKIFSMYNSDLESREKTMKLLKKHHGEYFLKILPNALTPDWFPDHDPRWFLDNFSFLVLKRNNLFEQCLSFMTSECIKIWYSKEPFSIKPHSLEAQKRDFDTFENIILAFEAQLRLLPLKKEIFYEDFCNKGPEDFLNFLGYCDFPLDLFKDFWLPPKQNTEQKLDYFKNKEGVLTWYKHSYLQSLFKI